MKLDEENRVILVPAQEADLADFQLSLQDAVLVLVLEHAPAAAAQRVALVVGNSAYQSVPFLPNPVNDATDVSASLKRLGLDVRTIFNAKYDDLRRALIEFTQRSIGAELAVIYFAGHGIQVSDENWLIPVDAELATDRTVENEAVGLQSLTRAVSGATKLGLVILDACRSNPFVPKMRSAGASRAVDRGFARVEPIENVLVAFAGRDGTTASDGVGRNSPFTESLLAHLETPGLEVRFLFANVRDDVMAATKREQQPFMYGSLSREQISLSGAALGQTTNEPNDDLVRSFIKDSTDQAALSQYLRAFPSGKHRDQAQQRLAWLSPAAPDETEGARQQARLPAPTSGPDSKPAEETARSRVVLTEEDPAHPGGHRYVGFARWQTDQYQRLRGDNHADIGIRADIEIPDRNLRIAVLLRSNNSSDANLSHVAFIKSAPANLGVAEVLGVLSKSDEPARGTSLAGLSWGVKKGFVLVGLSNVQADRTKNISLLREMAWFEFHFKYTNGRRAILAIEKGETGNRVYAAAFSAWGQ